MSPVQISASTLSRRALACAEHALQRSAASRTPRSVPLRVGEQVRVGNLQQADVGVHGVNFTSLPCARRVMRIKRRGTSVAATRVTQRSNRARDRGQMLNTR